MSDERFQYEGINHVALVCRDMKKTVDFYTNVLEMPLIKTLELGAGRGQHFFFDAGNGATIAYFWFPDPPEPAPGIASQHIDLMNNPMTTAIASMNHLAISIPLEKFDAYVDKLRSKGVTVHVINHTDDEKGYSEEVNDSVWIRSMYFRDPDGLALEFAAYTRDFRDDDVAHEPATWENRANYR